jgi:hypothetical protein
MNSPCSKLQGIKMSVLFYLSQPRFAGSTLRSDKLRVIKPYRFCIVLQMIRVIRARPACPVAPEDGTGVGSENRTGVICEICGLNGSYLKNQLLSRPGTSFRVLLERLIFIGFKIALSL